MDLFQNKYRIESTRLKNWDYRSNAMYFVTICSWQKEHLFGEIRNGEMILNEIGKIVEKEWLSMPAIRADMNLILDEFVVIPDHFHSIICIGENEFNKWRNTNNYQHGARGIESHGNGDVCVETEYFPSLRTPIRITLTHDIMKTPLQIVETEYIPSL